MVCCPSPEACATEFLKSKDESRNKIAIDNTLCEGHMTSSWLSGDVSHLEGRKRAAVEQDIADDALLNDDVRKRR